MTRLSRWFLPLSAVALALVLSNAQGPALADGGNGVLASATGSGHFSPGGEFRTFSFTANRQADGSVNGEYQLVSRAGAGAIVHVDVTCMSLVGNQAWVAGIITRSDNPAVIVGSVSYFRAVDNGEGAGSPPDQISLARINDRAGQDIVFCTEHPTVLPLNDVENGNVQISAESELGGLLVPSVFAGLRAEATGCRIDSNGVPVCWNGAWAPSPVGSSVRIDPDGCTTQGRMRVYTVAEGNGFDPHG